jgi:hypothetical protein
MNIEYSGHGVWVHTVWNCSKTGIASLNLAQDIGTCTRYFVFCCLVWR